MNLRVGIDIGSTTVKVVVLDEENKLLFRSYERHYSKARERACETLGSIEEMLRGKDVRLVITGSAGLGVAKAAGLDFVQEVYATAAAVNAYIPDTDAVIELGGEDAKIIFFGGALEERMNGSCAGGTGAFIDQMATLMNVTVNELDELSLKHEKIYPIASRCGVFAKSDIQPILNQGGRKEDVAASIFQAVVDQTVAGLTQGRELKGKIVFLGGPLHFLMGLRERFVDTLQLDGEPAVFPDQRAHCRNQDRNHTSLKHSRYTGAHVGKQVCRSRLPCGKHDHRTRYDPYQQDQEYIDSHDPAKQHKNIRHYLHQVILLSQ